MDFTCSGCGRYEFIPSRDLATREVIEHLSDVLDGFEAEPWQIKWLEHYQPELMRRFYDGIDKLLKERK